MIRAHTVQRAGALAKIARDGHVYRISSDYATLTKTEGLLVPKLVGINQASTFYGFCAYHDSTTFAPIEGREFVGTPEQCFLLAYRPFVKELYLKQSAIDSVEVLREADKGKTPGAQAYIQSIIDAYSQGTAAALHELKRLKQVFDGELLTKDFSRIRYCIFMLSPTPTIMSSGVIRPIYDFSGNLLQNLADLTVIPDTLSFSIIGTESGGAAVFSWREDSDTTSRLFLDSLTEMPWAKIPDALVRFCFEHMENIFLAPDWWEGLSPDEKRTLQTHAMANLPTTGSRSQGLTDDGRKYVSWEVAEIKAHGYSPTQAEP